MNIDFENLYNTIKESKRIILTTHDRPDGDAIGSEVALAKAIESLGKKIRIVNSDKTPKTLEFLDKIFRAEEFDENSINEYNKYDLIIILDNSFKKRLGNVEKILENKKVIIIDHHDYTQQWADIEIIDLNAASVGEILYDFFKYAGIKIDLDIATGIYVSLLTDTGHFSYPGTTPRAHLIAYDLLTIGVEPNKMHKLIYEHNSVEVTKLLAYTLENINVTDNGKILYVSIPYEMFEKYKVFYEETDYFIDHIKAIEGVPIIVFFREVEKGRIIIGLRSTLINVGEFASQYHGGGHKESAGMTIIGKLDQVVKDVIGFLEKEVVEKEIKKNI